MAWPTETAGLGGEAGTYAALPSTPRPGQGAPLQTSDLDSLGRFLTSDHPPQTRTRGRGIPQGKWKARRQLFTDESPRPEEAASQLRGYLLCFRTSHPSNCVVWVFGVHKPRVKSCLCYLRSHDLGLVIGALAPSSVSWGLRGTHVLGFLGRLSETTVSELLVQFLAGRCTKWAGLPSVAL